MASCEGVAAAGLKIVLEGLGLFKSFECDVGFHLLGQVLGCVGNLPCVVFCEAGAEIGSAADVALVWMGEAAEDVGVVHEKLLLGVSVTCLSYRTRSSLLFAFVALALLRQGYGGHHPSPFVLRLSRRWLAIRSPRGEGWWR